jgi:alpha-L-fucosidase
MEQANRLRARSAWREATRAAALAACVAILAAQPLRAEAPTVRSSIPGESPQEYAARMEWFREARFGVFICWGPCSLAEGEIGWSRHGPRPGREPATGGVPLEVYDNLYKQFDPTGFDASEWADLVKASGARYVIFLTKHHDGFCMFDSQLTDYKVTNSPFARDVTAELAEAFREAGIRIFWYYSQPDWHHPDYRTERHSQYVEYLHGQIRELCTNYGKIDGIWFDGLGGTAEDWDSPRLFEMIHALQPGAIINNRAGLPGDFDTPEQRIGRFQLDRPWESCITMNPGWAWLGADKPVKTLKECLHLLIRCAGGGGNLALDTGPMADGRIDPRQAQRYREMGVWLAKYGKSVYGTTGGPYKPGRWGVSTRNGNTVWLHVLEWEADELELPPPGRRVVSASALTGGEPTIRQDEQRLVVSVPEKQRNEIDTIIALELDGPAEELPVISPLAQGALTIGKSSSSSSDWGGGYTHAMAFDGDETTRWGAAPGTTSGWLEIDLGAPTTFDKALLLESPWDRVRRFELQYREGETWRTFYEGTTMGDLAIEFDPVTARYVRLNVLEATNVPTVWEVALYPPGVKLPALPSDLAAGSH